MPKSRIILCLGFFIALLPVLGFPNSWDHFFDTASGLLIVLLSVLISVDRRLTLKAKAEKRTQRKRAVATPAPEPEVVSEPEPIVSPEPEPVVEPVSAPAFQAASLEEERPRRRRRVRVIDADASVSEAPTASDTFDIHNTSEF